MNRLLERNETESGGKSESAISVEVGGGVVKVKTGTITRDDHDRDRRVNCDGGQRTLGSIFVTSIS